MLGIIGDVMDIRNFETQAIIREGIGHITNPFITGMKERNAYFFQNTVNPITIAFYIVPFVNAVTRIGSQEEKRLLFESMLPWKANESIPSTKRGCKGQYETVVEQAIRTCTNVKNRQNQIRDRGVEEIKRVITE